MNLFIVRKANGGVVKAIYPKVANPDSFANIGIMQSVQKRMLELIK